MLNLPPLPRPPDGSDSAYTASLQRWLRDLHTVLSLHMGLGDGSTIAAGIGGTKQNLDRPALQQPGFYAYFKNGHTHSAKGADLHVTGADINLPWGTGTADAADISMPVSGDLYVYCPITINLVTPSISVGTITSSDTKPTIYSTVTGVWNLIIGTLEEDANASGVWHWTPTHPSTAGGPRYTGGLYIDVSAVGAIDFDHTEIPNYSAAAVQVPVNNESTFEYWDTVDLITALESLDGFGANKVFVTDSGETIWWDDIAWASTTTTTTTTA